MLQMKPSCECCDVDLPPEREGALICSFECTFCQSCAESTLNGVCPNCRGTLVSRPMRVGPLLVKYPASVQRVVKPGGCAAQ